MSLAADTGSSCNFLAKSNLNLTISHRGQKLSEALDRTLLAYSIYLANSYVLTWAFCWTISNKFGILNTFIF